MIKNLQAVNWKEQFDVKSVEDMWIYLKSELWKQIVEHIPLKVDRKPKKKDYISRATKKHMKKRSNAWKRYRQFRSGKNYGEYKKIRNKVNEMARSDEDAYRKRFYGHMRKLQTVKDVVTALKKEDGELTVTDREAVDELANFFQKIFTKEDSNGFHQVEEDAGMIPVSTSDLKQL